MSFGANHRYLICWADHFQFAVGVELLREVHRITSIFAVPHAPGSVRGLLSLRSETHLVLDAGSMLTGRSVQGNDQARLLFCKPTVAPALALMVSRVGGMIHSEPHPISPEVGMTLPVPHLEGVIEGSVPHGLSGLPVLAISKLYESVAETIREQAITYASTAVGSGEIS
jgi:chemotaxis signal transduction protein